MSLISQKFVGDNLQMGEALLQVLISVVLLAVAHRRMVSHEDGLLRKLGNFSIVLEIKIQIINVKKIHTKAKQPFIFAVFTYQHVFFYK